MLVRSSGGALRCTMGYRLYCLNDAMHVVSRQEIAAADDLAALKEAKILPGDRCGTLAGRALRGEGRQRLCLVGRARPYIALVGAELCRPCGR